MDTRKEEQKTISTVRRRTFIKRATGITLSSMIGAGAITNVYATSSV